MCTILPKSLGHIATLAYRQACPEAVVRGSGYYATGCFVAILGSGPPTGSGPQPEVDPNQKWLQTGSGPPTGSGSKPEVDPNRKWVQIGSGFKLEVGPNRKWASGPPTSCGTQLEGCLKHKLDSNWQNH